MEEKIKFLVVFLFLAVIICFCSLNGYVLCAEAYPETDYQKMALDYLTEELSAHGAMLFAASLASITFLVESRKWLEKKWNVTYLEIVSLMVIGGLLFAALIFVAFRLIWYGRLIQSTIHLTPTRGCSFSQYWELVSQKTIDELIFLLNPVKHYSSATSRLLIDPINGLLVSILLGIVFFAFIIKKFFAINEKPDELLNRVIFFASIWFILSWIIPPLRELGFDWGSEVLITFSAYFVLTMFLFNKITLMQKSITWVFGKLISYPWSATLLLITLPFLYNTLIAGKVLKPSQFVWTWIVSVAIGAIGIRVAIWRNRQRAAAKPAFQK